MCSVKKIDFLVPSSVKDALYDKRRGRHHPVLSKLSFIAIISPVMTSLPPIFSQGMATGKRGD